jgi:tetratricopeptide (TPR) repeat protein
MASDQKSPFFNYAVTLDAWQPVHYLFIIALSAILTDTGDSAMPNKGPKANASSATGSQSLSHFAEISQLDFELNFYGGILERCPHFTDVLRAHGNNLTLKGRYADGLDIDKKLISLRPGDPLAYYNLACSYALMKKTDLAIKTLTRAVELGYRDFRYIREDKDLDAVRSDPRFRELLKQFGA